MQHFRSCGGSSGLWDPWSRAREILVTTLRVGIEGGRNAGASPAEHDSPSCQDGFPPARSSRLGSQYFGLAVTGQDGASDIQRRALLSLTRLASVPKEANVSLVLRSPPYLQVLFASRRLVTMRCSISEHARLGSGDTRL